MAVEEIRGILIDVVQGFAHITNVERSLQSYYRILHCDCIDITTRTVDGVVFDIICDDNGLFSEQPLLSACDRNGDAMLVGSIFVVGHDEENCDIRNLTADECAHVMRNIHPLPTRMHPEPYPILTNCEYE